MRFSKNSKMTDESLEHSTSEESEQEEEDVMDSDEEVCFVFTMNSLWFNISICSCKKHLQQDSSSQD